MILPHVIFKVRERDDVLSEPVHHTNVRIYHTTSSYIL